MKKENNYVNNDNRKKKITMVIVAVLVLILMISLISCSILNAPKEVSEVSESEMTLEPTAEVQPAEEAIVEEKPTLPKEEKVYTLNRIGDEEIYLYVGEVYDEPGFELTDQDGNRAPSEIESLVETIGEVNNNTAGDYLIVYRYEDQEETRIVHFRAKEVEKTGTKKETVDETVKEEVVEVAQPEVVAMSLSNTEIRAKVGEAFTLPQPVFMDQNGNFCDSGTLIGEVMVENHVDVTKPGTYQIIYGFRGQTLWCTVTIEENHTEQQQAETQLKENQQNHTTATNGGGSGSGSSSKSHSKSDNGKKTATQTDANTNSNPAQTTPDNTKPDETEEKPGEPGESDKGDASSGSETEGKDDGPGSGSKPDAGNGSETGGKDDGPGQGSKPDAGNGSETGGKDDGPGQSSKPDAGNGSETGGSNDGASGDDAGADESDT